MRGEMQDWTARRRTAGALRWYEAFRTELVGVAEERAGSFSSRIANWRVATMLGGPAAPASKRSLTSDAKVDMTLFAEADRDGDTRLSWAEFQSLMPSLMRKQFTHDAMRSWFLAADRNSDGYIDIHDYWRWSLGRLITRHGKTRRTRT